MCSNLFQLVNLKLFSLNSRKNFEKSAFRMKYIFDTKALYIRGHEKGLVVHLYHIINLYSANLICELNMIVMTSMMLMMRLVIRMMMRLTMVTTLKTVSTLLVTTVEPGRLRSTSVVTPISS